MQKKIRVRFSPSPTGYFHIGSVRTALINYLYAKKYKGDFVLRIEDTDKERSKKEYEDDIIRSLDWLNLSWDEGLTEEGEKGNYAPYRQSERGDFYKKYIFRLLEEKKAYYCFCDKEKLKKSRERQREEGLPPRYDGNCFSLSDKERSDLLEKNADHVIRLHITEKESIEFDDMVRGRVKFMSEEIGGDFVIAKKDLSALYNFACVVDDYEMKITHILRGEDHLSNTPKQILMQRALGFDSPRYAHLSLILGPDKNKLSKRHAAVSTYQYREMGYLPEALLNFIVLLGWNPGDDREIYSLSEMIESFTVERCRKSGAIFDVNKLNFINSQYLKKKSEKEFVELCLPYLISSGLVEPSFKEDQYPPAYGGVQAKITYFLPQREISIDLTWIEMVVSLYKEKIKILSEISSEVDFFFKKELNYEKELLIWKKMTESEVVKSLDKSIEIMQSIRKWEKNYIEKALMEEAEKAGDRGSVLWPFRAALTGKKASAGPIDVALVLGPEETIKRLKNAKNKLI